MQQIKLKYNKKAFTLVELLVSILLMSVVLSAVISTAVIAVRLIKDNEVNDISYQTLIRFRDYMTDTNQIVINLNGTAADLDTRLKSSSPQAILMYLKNDPISGAITVNTFNASSSLLVDTASSMTWCKANSKYQLNFNGSSNTGYIICAIGYLKKISAQTDSEKYCYDITLVSEKSNGYFFEEVSGLRIGMVGGKTSSSADAITYSISPTSSKCL